MQPVIALTDLRCAWHPFTSPAGSKAFLLSPQWDSAWLKYDFHGYIFYFFKMFFLWNYILYTVKCTCQPPVISICLLYIYKLLIHYLFCILTGTWKEWFIVSIIWFLFWDFLAFHFSSFYDGCLVVLLSSISWTCLVKWSSITTTLVVDRLYIPRFHG